MKKSSISASISASLALAPTLARAHPGHSALDFTAGAPHTGHESELVTLLIATAMTITVFVGARWLSSRRR